MMRTARTLTALAVSMIALSALPATAVAAPITTEVTGPGPLGTISRVVPPVDFGPCHRPGGLFWP